MPIDSVTTFFPKAFSRNHQTLPLYSSGTGGAF
jgi:hypothetical protein